MRCSRRVTFKTKPQLAAEMLREIHEQNIVPYRYVLADCLYGESPEFLEAVESLIGKTYFVAVAFNTLCWLKSPLQQIKKYKHKGEVLTKKVLKKGSKKPITVEDFARNLHETFWYRRIVSEGEQKGLSNMNSPNDESRFRRTASPGKTYGWSLNAQLKKLRFTHTISVTLPVAYV